MQAGSHKYFRFIQFAQPALLIGSPGTRAPLPLGRCRAIILLAGRRTLQVSLPFVLLLRQASSQLHIRRRFLNTTWRVSFAAGMGNTRRDRRRYFLQAALAKRPLGSALDIDRRFLAAACFSMIRPSSRQRARQGIVCMLAFSTSFARLAYELMHAYDAASSYAWSVDRGRRARLSAAYSAGSPFRASRDGDLAIARGDAAQLQRHRRMATLAALYRFQLL